MSLSEKISQKNPEITAPEIPLFFLGSSKKFRSKTVIRMRLGVILKKLKCIKKLV